MLKDKIISVISSNTLVSVGLKSILQEYFSAGIIHLVNGYDEYITAENDASSDLIFMPPDIYILNEYFHGIRSKVVLMFEKNEKSLINQSSLTLLNLSLSQSEIVDNLNSIFNAKISSKRIENMEVLSGRESEVLKLVAIGFINKQIAHMLNISLHTVISHRKNVTRKLSINTVSGLTVYALLNGLITSEDLDHVNNPRTDLQL